MWLKALGSVVIDKLDHVVGGSALLDSFTSIAGNEIAAAAEISTNEPYAMPSPEQILDISLVPTPGHAVLSSVNNPLQISRVAGCGC